MLVCVSKWHISAINSKAGYICVLQKTAIKMLCLSRGFLRMWFGGIEVNGSACGSLTGGVIIIDYTDRLISLEIQRELMKIGIFTFTIVIVF